MPTNFPQQGDDLKVSLRNSNYPQFDRAWAEDLRDDYPQIWDAGGNIRGNEAFTLWGRARDGSEGEAVLEWIREREAWAARHFDNGDAFTGSSPDEPNISNIAGVVAWVKWGVVGQLGEGRMKEVLNTMKKKIDAQKLRKTGAYRNLPDYEVKRMPTFVVKADEAQGIVEQVVAVIGNIDDGGDMIMPGAFTKSIDESARRVRVLDNHQAHSIHNVIGKPLWMREVGQDQLPVEVLRYAPDATGGLLVATQYAMKTDNGRNAFNLVAGGFVTESSIGYDPVQIEFVEANCNGEKCSVRQLKEIRLWEYSNVLWGMNPATATLSAKKTEGDMKKDKKAVLTYQNLPLASRDRAWDSTEAEGRVRRWASEDESEDLDTIDWKRYANAFFYRDPEADEQVGGYKLGYADVINGELTAIPSAIFAVAGVLQGARGGVGIPEAEQERVKTQVARYYAKMREEFDDDGLVPPWDQEEMGANKGNESKMQGMPMFGDYLQGCIHKMYTMICDDSYMYGNIGREQRKLMSSILGDMLDLFSDRCPQEIYEMPSHTTYSYMMALEDAVSEVKARRAISKANAQRIRATIDQIHAAATALEEMLDTAMPSEEEPVEPEDDMAGNEDEENKGRDTEAGPPDEAPTEAELLRQRIEMYQKLNKLT